MSEGGEILSIFLSSFLSATFLPFSSEAVLAALVKQDNFYLYLAWATLGNTLGGMTNYIIGRFSKLYWAHKYLGIKSKSLDRAKIYVDRFGVLVAFFSFLPIIGDPLAFVLGIYRINAVRVVVFMSAGKFLRYYLVSTIFV